MPVQVVILVPGIMGSVLMLGDEMIWPGPPSSLFLPYKKMQELMRDDLVPTDCIRKFSISDQYADLIDDLETCGFHEADKTLVIAAYDWRKDNAKSAETLARHLDDAVARHGNDAEVSLVAHSMGGLVSRYYLESGDFNARPGFAAVRRLVTLATPHRGAAIALPLVLGYEKRLFLSKDQVLQVCSDPRYPAAYQLLPPRGEPFVVDGSANAQVATKDIYDSVIAAALGLVENNLASAAAFHKKLDTTRRPKHVRYFCFTGTRQTTTTFVRLRKVAGPKLEPVKVEQDSGGDGTVPTWSSFFPGIEREFCGGEHGTIYKNDSLRKTLAAILGKPGVLLGVPSKVDLSVRDRVVEPHDVVHAALTFPPGVQDFDGVLTIERAKIDPDTEQVTGFDAPVQIHPIKYQGIALDTMALEFVAPNIRGTYRVSFRDNIAAQPAGFDELIVQPPPPPVTP